MIENIFENKYAECLIARDSSTNQAIGLALYFFTYSTWLGVPGLYLEDLYVSPEYRGKGLGKRLFGELGQIAKERNCGRVEWRVLKVSFFSFLCSLFLSLSLSFSPSLALPFFLFLSSLFSFFLALSAHLAGMLELPINSPRVVEPTFYRFLHTRIKSRYS
ncbi:acyl-CoA N-acyltransferase [Naematelia encephala]|uniref:Acyl-CoA N-acyltransferase n=1 Tax=Naematelia encephala TaxID=71784 RepID=A0A1Y2B1B9_9TREE|nr:acyl-CoA N-acyltransferase [Naematelia encephala]